MRHKNIVITLCVFFIYIITFSVANLVIKVRPQKPRIYINAPPGVSTLTVTGIDDVTGKQTNVFRFSSGEDSTYFTIDSKGVMRTNRTINRTVGTTFKFFIFGSLKGLVTYKSIEIIVSEKNEHPPVFTKDRFTATAYRYLDDRVIVKVSAHDADLEGYNTDIKYFIPNYPASDLFSISDDGDIRLIKAPASGVKILTFNVFAINEGSPAKTSKTNVTIDFVDYQQPEIFCFITGIDFIKLCWKNPMVGRNITGFIVKITGRISEVDMIPVEMDTPEVCHTLRGTEVGKHYRFQVSVQGTPDNDIELVLNKTGVGFTSECLNSHFSPCSYLNPCQNNGVCLTSGERSTKYKCECRPGWRGMNCTEQDVCENIPCRNNGRCLFLGHQLFKCECLDGFLGANCQHFNTCMTSPCRNGGVCHMDLYGVFTCDCPDNYSGENCEIFDACRPSPCRGRGLCNKVGDSDFRCDCIIGYEGKRCDVVDKCLLEMPCTNEGTCLTTGNSTYICECPPGTTGTTCEHFDPCSQFQCNNNGTCTGIGKGRYRCDCPTGFYGEECQNFDPCLARNCNSGSCIKVGSDQTECVCDEGYFGNSCQFMDPCSAKPCGNGGVCRNTSIDEFECDCLPEWFGENCENLKSCVLNLCENNSTCINRPPNSYECVCPIGYYGQQCNLYNECVDRPCRNSGVCENITDGYVCNCRAGFGGMNCEYRDLCRNNPCGDNGECITVSDTFYICNCSSGYTGESCEIRDYCSDETICRNAGECVSFDNDFKCLCAENFYGRNCQFKNHCKVNPCINATCQLKYQEDAAEDEAANPDVDGYICQCSDGFTGKNCELRIMGCRGRCLNDGTCDGSVCLCPEGFMGEFCETPVTPCEPNPCNTNQFCIVTGARHQCQCLNGARNSQCEKGCQAETTVDESGEYHWPQTDIQETAEVLCPFGPIPDGDGLATRECFKQLGKAVWDKPNTVMCSKMDLGAVNQELDALKSLTSDASQLSPEDVTKVTGALENIYRFSIEHKEIAESMVTVVSNLVDVNRSVMIESSKTSQTSNRLLTILEDYSADVKSVDDVITVSTANIDIKSIDVVPSSVGNRSISYEPQPSNQSQAGISISLPPEIFQDGDERNVRVQFMGFQKSTFFNPTNPTEFESQNVDKQRVVTAIVKGKKLQNLKSPVSFTMPSIEPKSNHTCVFWDVDKHQWSSEGIKTIISNDVTECQSDHLTSFAILLDPSPEHVLPVIHEEILTYITYIGCAISMVGLILTIITYSLFKCLHGEKSGKILLNLCVALLLMNITFLLGSQSSTMYGDDVCITVAVFLHLFLLATLMWMLVEAVEMYQALVTVFKKYARFYMLKRCIAGWGIPILIVSMVLAVDLDHYKPNTDFCFLSQSSPVAYYISLIGPACLILITNTIVFIMVARVILKPRFQQQERGTMTVTPAQVRGAFTVMILLGITWVFGPLAIREAKLVFNYLFCILNSLQGFLLFVFRCLFNPEARLAWIQLIKTGTFKRRRGPVKSVYSSEASSKMDRYNGQSGHSSSNGHSKSNIIQANGWHGNKLNNECDDDSPYMKAKRGHKSLNRDSNMLSGKESVNTEVEYIGDGRDININDDSTRL